MSRLPADCSGMPDCLCRDVCSCMPLAVKLSPRRRVAHRAEVSQCPDLVRLTLPANLFRYPNGNFCHRAPPGYRSHSLEICGQVEGCSLTSSNHSLGVSFLSSQKH